MRICRDGECRPVLAGGEQVCGRCGKVIEDLNDERNYVTSRDAQMLHATSHNPADHSKHTVLGSQHDMISPTNTGLAMELCNPRKRDHSGHAITKELLSEPYVTGQVLGKGAFVVEYTEYYVVLNCNKHTVIMDREPYVGEIFQCRPCDKQCTAERVYEKPIYRAVTSLLDDATYRAAKTQLNHMLLDRGADETQANTMGDVIRRRYYRYVEVWKRILTLGALLDIEKNHSGTMIEARENEKREYVALVLQLKSMLYEDVPPELIRPSNASSSTSTATPN